MERTEKPFHRPVRGSNTTLKERELFVEAVQNKKRMHMWVENGWGK